MQHQYIPISDIDDDYRYCYRMEMDVSDLRKSIQRVGIQLPLWLIQDKKLHIIDGFCRIQIARELQISKIPAIIYDVDEFDHIFLSALSLNSSIKKLSTIEKYKAIQISRKFLSASKNNEIMNILDFNFIPSVTKNMNSFADLPDWLLAYFHRMNISFKNLNRLSKYLVASYMNWFRMANFLTFKGSELVQIMETIHEICIRDQMSADVLWEALSMEQRIAEKMTPQQMSVAIKSLIFRTRYPRLSQINDNIKRKVNQLKRNHKGSMDIIWDRSLEDPILKFLFELKDPTVIDNILSFLKNTEIQNIIKEIFDQWNHYPSVEK
jgi:hypothetical protein